MKIVVIHEVSYQDKPVYEYQDFAERLAARGHDVTVIDFCENRKGTLGNVRMSRTGTGEVRLITLPNNGIPILKYLNARWRFPRLLTELIQRDGVDAVLLYSVFINGTGAVSVCHKARIPIVYRVLDAYHKLRKSRLQSLLLLLGERYIYRRADILSVTNDQMAQYVDEVAPDGRKGIVRVTDHGVDTSHFRRLPRDLELAAKLGINSNDFVCLFLGTTYSFSRLDILARNVKQLRTAIPRFKLLILGAGELDEPIRRAAVEAGVSEYVLQPGMISYNELPSYMSLADIAVNPFEINDITRDIIPIKMLQYLAAELPVISTPLPDLARKIPHEISGVFYSESDDIEDFTKSVMQLCRSADLASTGVRARNYVSHHHSMDRVVAELESLLGCPWKSQ